MVIGHAGCPGHLHNFIYQFHMPLFFFFSGFCFKDYHLQDFKTYASRRIKGIYLPFVKFALLFLVLHNLFFHLNIYNGSYGYNGGVSCLYTYKDILTRVFKITTSMSHEEQLLGGYWFLKILFFTSFIGFGFYKFLRNNAAKIIGIIVLLTATLILSLSESFSSFWYTFYLSCYATLFFIAGKELSSIKIPSQWWFTALCFISVTSLSIINPAGFTTQKNLPLYIVGALSGILMVKNISNNLVNIRCVEKLLVHVGNNTLPILTWHFLSFKAVSLLIIKTYDLPIELLASFPVISEYSQSGWWILYTIVGVAAPLCLIAIPNIKESINFSYLWQRNNTKTY